LAWTLKTEIEQSGWEQKEPLPAREDGLVDSESKKEHSSPRQSLALWTGVLGSAIVWLVQLQTTYAMVPWACSSGHRWMLPVASLAFLVAAALPGVIAAKLWFRSRGTERYESESSGVGRRRFMALLGVMNSALFLLLILAQGIPAFFIHPCLE
jgi:hypothetical protein